MTRLFIYIELVVLIVEEEATPLLVDRKIERITLIKHVGIITARYLGFNLDNLPTHFWFSHRKCITPSI